MVIVLYSRSQGKEEEAERMLKESIRFGPHFADAYSSLASLYADQVSLSLSRFVVLVTVDDKHEIIKCFIFIASQAFFYFMHIFSFFFLCRGVQKKQMRFTRKVLRTARRVLTFIITTVCFWWT